jgi:hypothetical protein
MARTVQDENMLFWEAYASTGEFGYPERAVIVFHCLTDMTKRARFVVREADRSEVEQDVERMSDAELRGLLEESRPLA